MPATGGGRQWRTARVWRALRPAGRHAAPGAACRSKAQCWHRSRWPRRPAEALVLVERLVSIFDLDDVDVLFTDMT
jgi:hypothetical protein